jgi:hypothetical protein
MLRRNNDASSVFSGIAPPHNLPVNESDRKLRLSSLPSRRSRTSETG